MSATARNKQRILVLDIGKTNTRLVLCDESGQVIHSASRASPVVPEPPYPHLPLEDTFDWFLDAIRECGDASRIDAIVPVAHGATAALVDSDGELALPVLDYEWSGVEEIEDTYPRPPFAETRSPALGAGLNLGRQLWYQAQTYPDAWERVSQILLYPQYWAYRLCGVAAAEVSSLGCHTDLWNVAAGEPSSLWQTATQQGGPSVAQLPALRSAWSLLGSPLESIRSRSALRSDCRIHCGVHDSNAAYLVHRAGREAPFTVVSSGTWVVVMAHGTEIARLDPERGMLANVDVLGDTVATARFMGGREFEAIAGTATGPRNATLPDAEAVIKRGALALPSMADQGGAFPRRRGELQNADRLSASERGALASLYLALETETSLALLGARGDLIVEGPLASNEVYLAALAALRPDQPVYRSTDQTGSVRGAVLLAQWPPRSACCETVAVPPRQLAGLTAYREHWQDEIERSLPG